MLEEVVGGTHVHPKVLHNSSNNNKIDSPGSVKYKEITATLIESVSRITEVYVPCSVSRCYMGNKE